MREREIESDKVIDRGERLNRPNKTAFVSRLASWQQIKKFCKMGSSRKVSQLIMRLASNENHFQGCVMTV